MYGMVWYCMVLYGQILKQLYSQSTRQRTLKITLPKPQKSAINIALQAKISQELSIYLDPEWKRIQIHISNPIIARFN
jgi:hypothetical protein